MGKTKLTYFAGGKSLLTQNNKLSTVVHLGWWMLLRWVYVVQPFIQERGEKMFIQKICQMPTILHCLVWT
jgi:hypothetical protein